MVKASAIRVFHILSYLIDNKKTNLIKKTHAYLLYLEIVCPNDLVRNV